MFFLASRFWVQFSKQCLLLACFFAFSFNHIALTKYHFVLGQASFYCIALALLTSHFKIEWRNLFFVAGLILYCLASARFNCVMGYGICTNRPYTAAISILFVFICVQYTAFLVEKNLGFEQDIVNYFVYGAWAVVILAIPDIWTIAHGGVISASPYGLDSLSSLGMAPYGMNRLRGFTQEPSYLGMVIAVLYPFCFIRLNQKCTFPRLILVIGLWTCLAFSLSRTGLLTCLLLSVLILLEWPKRLLLVILGLGCLALGWVTFPELRTGSFLSLSWMPLFAATNLDGSSLVRSAHIVAAIKTWLAHPILGVGLGQSGYEIPQFYPGWYTPASPEYGLWQPKAVFGGVPSFSFIPKLLAEIGLLGVWILCWWVVPVLRTVIRRMRSFLNNAFAKQFTYSFLGFLIASFGIDGYLYLPAWLVLGALWGLIRQKSRGAQEVLPSS